MPDRVADASTAFFILLNVGSGRHDPRTVRGEIEAVLGAAGCRYEITLVENPARLRHLSEQAVKRAQGGDGVVVVAGGDGSINAVARSVLGSGCRFGVLPQGTFNYFSRTHGIPADTAEATRLLLVERARPVQVGLVNDRPFLVNASLGLYPELLEEREAYKQRFGRSRLVALGAALASVAGGHRQLRLRIEHEGQTRDIRTPTVFVGNNRLQLEQVGIDEAAAVEAGRLTAVTLEPSGTAALLGLLLRGALGRLGEADKVASFEFRDMTVAPLREHTRRLKVATDGEVVWLDAPLRFRVARERLLLIRPEHAPELEAAERKRA